MRLSPDKLAAQFSGQPPALVWIAIADPLLGEETCDSARRAARQAGFIERKVFHCDKSPHWQEALTEAQALSLFAEKTLIEIRAQAGKLEHALLTDYLKNPSPDHSLLLITEKVENSSQKTQWFKALEAACCFVPVLPLDAARFPEWLAARARQQQLQLSNDALALIIEQTQGNLLAASQELEKLSLQFGAVAIDADMVSAGLANSAQFEMFSLNDALLAGDSSRSQRILHTLLAEGEHPLAILGALGRELRQLTQARELIDAGNNPGAVLSQLGVWDKRKPLFQQALKRLPASATRKLMQWMADCDLAVKGMHARPADELLQQLILCACKQAT